MIYPSIIKRILDIFLSILALPIVAVVAIPVAIAVKLDDGGPVFYLSTRLGKDMKPFQMYKFRSMKVNAPDIRNKDGTTYNGADDPRLTKAGRFLRRTSIDELPQVLNVLKGDMSWIGPRPSPTGDKSMYPPEFFKKYQLRPGITGYNQAIYRNSNSMEERIKNDAYYVDHVSFRLDARIFFATIKTVFSGKGVYRNNDK